MVSLVAYKVIAINRSEMAIMAMGDISAAEYSLRRGMDGDYFSKTKIVDGKSNLEGVVRWRHPRCESGRSRYWRTLARIVR